MKLSVHALLAVAIAAATAATVIAHAASSAHAQTYPAKPVRIIVPFAPGGGTDTIARTLAQKLTEAWAQTVIVENRAGAGGLIGSQAVLSAPADGYTLGLGTISTHAIIPLTQAKPRYDPLKDFAAVTLISTVPYVLAAHPSLPARNLAEFVAFARGKPGQISYGTPGYGTGIHLTAEYLSSFTGIKLVHVPYKGDALVLVDLFAGQISTAVLTTIVTGQHVRSGRIRGVAMLTAQRTRDLPNVPTAREAGYAIESQSWQGISVRAGTPPDIVRKLNTDIVRVLNTPDVRNGIEAQGNTVSPGTPEEFERFIAAEIAKWRKVIASAGIKIE
jgi:tripartite-type tricarboxylate transporter receptor subunit TctC